MRNIHFCTYRSATKPVADTNFLTWEEIREAYFSQHSAIEQPEGESWKDYKRNRLPAFSFTELDPDNPTRSSKNVVSITAMVVDMDEIDREGFEKLVKWASQFECLIYSSPSHSTMDAPKARLIFPLSEPVRAAKWPRAWKALDEAVTAACGAKMDRACKDTGRCYFLPASTPQSLSEAPHFLTHTQGPTLPITDLISQQRASEGPSQYSPSAPALERTKKATLKELQSYQSAMPVDHELFVPLTQLSRGEAVVDADGHRHDLWSKLTSHLIVTKFADCEPSSFRALLTPSIEANNALRPEEAGSFDRDIDRLVEGAYEKLDNEEWQARNERFRKSLSGKIDPLSLELLEKQAFDANVSTEDYIRQAVISVGNAFFIRNPQGGYSINPVKKENLPFLIRDWVIPHLLEVSPHGPHDFFHMPKNAPPRIRGMAEILNTVGTEANQLEYDWRSDSLSFQFDAQGRIDTVSYGLASPPSITPTFDEDVQKWFEEFVGESYDQVVRWLCLATDLNAPLKALILFGSPGTGKTLFAKAVAHLFSKEDVTPAQQWPKNFGDVMSSPVVFADETLPPQWEGLSGLKELKTFLTEDSHIRDVKYRDPYYIRGFYRLIVAANDHDVFQIGAEHATLETQQAIAERFLYVGTGDKAIELINDLAGDTWGGLPMRVAEHLEWIRHNADPSYYVRQGRMGLASQQAMVRDMLQASDAKMSILVDWFIAFILNPEDVLVSKTNCRNIVVEDDGSIHITPNLLARKEIINLYNDSNRDWTEALVTKYLRNLADGECKRRRMRGVEKDIRRNFYQVRLEKLVTMREGNYSLEELKDALLSKGGIKDQIDKMCQPAKVVRMGE